MSRSSHTPTPSAQTGPTRPVMTEPSTQTKALLPSHRMNSSFPTSCPDSTSRHGCRGSPAPCYAPAVPVQPKRLRRNTDDIPIEIQCSHVIALQPGLVAHVPTRRRRPPPAREMSPPDQRNGRTGRASSNPTSAHEDSRNRCPTPTASTTSSSTNSGWACNAPRHRAGMPATQPIFDTRPRELHW